MKGPFVGAIQTAQLEFHGGGIFVVVVRCWRRAELASVTNKSSCTLLDMFSRPSACSEHGCGTIICSAIIYLACRKLADGGFLIFRLDCNLHINLCTNAEKG